MSEKFIWFDGKKFTRDDKTGYYLNSTIRKRLHRYVWEYYNGEIPKGCCIHHIDEDKSNNDISNLMMISSHRHAVHHSNERLEKLGKQFFVGLMDNARVFASKWHGTKAGREWHKKHYEGMKSKLYQKKEYVCEQCGKPFVATNNGRTRFCSNNCKSAFRRASGVDDVKKVCPVCGKCFVVNKYSRKECCSRKCAAAKRKITSHQQVAS